MDLMARKIFVAGHRGMVGSAVLRKLHAIGHSNILTVEKGTVDLRDQTATNAFFEQERPEVVILAAARVGGIQANIASPGTFLYENLAIQTNVIHAAQQSGTARLVFLGSSCIYPTNCPQPMREEYLLTGPLEPTNEGYAIAKIAGMKMVEYYHRQYGMDGFSLMPCNIYGTNDSFDLQNSHVLSALVRRFTDAVDDGIGRVELWGTGRARREFLHVDDLADAILMLTERMPGDGRFINVGSGTDISIRDLALLIASKVGYDGEIAWNAEKPDGMLLKCLDVSRMREMGFHPLVTLEDGIERTIADYRTLKSRSAA
ncbi:GDP-L-fucose synthetase (EC 1.1.1.271) [Azospirillum palustre]